jgi:hypothetical protein
MTAQPPYMRNPAFTKMGAPEKVTHPTIATFQAIPNAAKARRVRGDLKSIAARSVAENASLPCDRTPDGISRAAVGAASWREHDLIWVEPLMTGRRLVTSYSR